MYDFVPIIVSRQHTYNSRRNNQSEDCIADIEVMIIRCDLYKFSFRGHKIIILVII